MEVFRKTLKKIATKSVKLIVNAKAKAKAGARAKAKAEAKTKVKANPSVVRNQQGKDKAKPAQEEAPQTTKAVTADNDTLMLQRWLSGASKHTDALRKDMFYRGEVLDAVQLCGSCAFVSYIEYE